MKYVLLVEVACVLALYCVSMKIEKEEHYKMTSTSKVTSLVIYDNGCFDAKEGNKTVVRCI
jgi:hypothetical protein